MNAQLIANSVIIGSVYALVACGFSLIFATNNFVHFAHGASVVASAYIAYASFAAGGFPFWMSCILTLVFAASFGAGMFRLVYRPLQHRGSSNIVLLIASVGILTLIENLVLLLFGADVKTMDLLQVQEGLPILGAVITPLQVAIIATSILLFVLLHWVMHRTQLGRNMRAVADNKELAQIVGINEQRIANLSFMLGSVLAGLAGILIALEQNLSPSMGTMLMVKGFTGAVIGGITSVPAAIVGSYLLGFAENFGIWWLPSGYKDAIAFSVLFLFLLFKPTGLFGLDKGVKD